MELPLIKPYTSLTLGRVTPGRGGPALLKEILDEVEELLDFTAPKSTRKLVDRTAPLEDKDLAVGALHYVESRRPAWTSDSQTKDVINHLVVVCLRKNHVGVVLTDTAWCGPFLKRCNGTNGGLSALVPIDEGTLNAAFAEGAVRTLWLSGIHRRTSVKADSKVLIGEDIRYALDPLGDQTYYFTAARCVTEMNKRPMPVGVSPRRSRVWIGPSRSWDDFRDYASSVLRCLEAVEKKHKSDDAPIPILAPGTIRTDDVSDAFDVSIIAPEVAAEDSDDETREMHEKLAYDTRFDVVSASGPNLAADVWQGRTRMGQVDIQVDLTNPADIRYGITPTFEEGQKGTLQELVTLCKNRRWFQIRYESGHTLSDGRIYSTRFRDVRFDNWLFVDFTDFDIRKEKPAKKKSNRDVYVPERIGSDDSLFCWISRYWPINEKADRGRGWLVCDDGSGEIADFIHFDADAYPPVLTVIHVKGSHSKELDRSISVSDYEVVTAQAEKNLRFLDRLILNKGLEKGIGTRKWKLVWHDGARQPDRTGFLAVLRRLGENYRRRVVIVQPRLSQGILEGIRAEKASKDAKKVGRPSGGAVRLQQLETMLLGAQNACRNLGAEFWVVADGSPAPTPAHQASPGRTPRRRTARGRKQ